jgi:NADH-quinone oxidoreductase subunit C
MSTQERVVAALGGVAHKIVPQRQGELVVEIDVGVAVPAMAALRDSAGFDTNVFVTAIDRYPAEPRFTICWAFLSTTHNDRVRVQARISGEKPQVPTITGLWPGTAYSERECFDMFGIVFDGHVGLKRLLMPQGFDHFPLRKEFPHQGIEPDRLYREWDQRRRERSPLRSESES